MTTQNQIQNDTENVLRFLRLKATSRGLIDTSQKTLASEYGLPHITFHRLVHRLIEGGRLTISGGGAYAKVLKLSGLPPGNASLSTKGGRLESNQESGPTTDGLSFGKV